ncbi:outer membrane cobalamin receptor protein [Opitutaceae bacterium TAV1]|nr:outer membrane cobalamin receptor protein [Opitutaceae bacterium TAV1]
MNFPFRLSLLSVAAASCAHARTLPPPASATGAEPPVTLDTVVVSATPFERSQADLISSTNVLSGQDLLLRQQATLGETLSAQPGMSSTYFGPGASRPIIRGLGGNRVRMLANGVDTIDASTTSPDHAVSLEPFLVKRIEVVRGPASLLYGSSAVGGVVNVIDHRVETGLPAATVSGELDAHYGTNADEFVYGGILDVALWRTEDRALVLHLDGFKRSSDDVRIPGYADPSDPVNKGRLTNTAIDSDGGSVGLSWVSGDFNAGINYNGFNTTYGVPNETDVEIDMKQRRVDFTAGLDRDFGIFSGARFKFGEADYRHREIEDGEVGTTFTNKGINSRFELLHQDLGGFDGSWGVEFNRSDFSAIGEEAFLPTTLTNNIALFLFEEAKRGDFTWQFGARYEHQNIDADPFDSVLFINGVDPSRTYGSRTDRRDVFSGSAGVIYAFNPTWALALSLTATERAPNAQELYADGPHIGTDAYEVGDPGLDLERSFGAELSLRKRTGFVTGSAGLFVNAFNGFIYENATGALVDFEGSGDPDEFLPEYRFIQRDAIFYGAEIETTWHLHASESQTLDLKLNADYTVAEDSHGNPLPRIPPLKGLIGLAWASGPWSAGADVQLVAKQSRNAENETDTAGYQLLGVYAGYRFAWNRVVWDLFVRGSNLTDEDARLHTSFLKDISPLPGRSVVFGLRAGF